MTHIFQLKTPDMRCHVRLSNEIRERYLCVVIHHNSANSVLKAWSERLTDLLRRETNKTCKNLVLSHNNPCFPCNITFTNCLILYTCEIRFYDVIDRTVHVYVYNMTSSYAKIPKHGQLSMIWIPIFQFNSLNSVVW